MKKSISAKISLTRSTRLATAPYTGTKPISTSAMAAEE